MSRFGLIRTDGCEVGELVYLPDEYSFTFVPLSTENGTSLLINDVHLELDSSCRIISVWGLCPYTRWIDSELKPPRDIVDGSVRYYPDQPLRAGASVRLLNSEVQLPTYIDRQKGWLELRGDVRPTTSCAILPGVLLQIGSRGEFSALWLQPTTGFQSLS